MNRKKRVLHISEANTLEESFLKKKFDYKHFNYKKFFDEDNLIEMWQRLAVVLLSYKPDIILLNFKHKDCINQQEREYIEKFAVVLDLS